MGSNTKFELVAVDTSSYLTPKQVTDEMKMLSLLRQELQNTHEDYDGAASAEPPIEPALRTMDAKTLQVLKFSSYPFILCEEAPKSYHIPVPYNLKDAVAVLEARVRGLESHLREVKAQASSKRQSSFKSFGDNGGNRTPDECVGTEGSELAQLLMNVMGGDVCFADVLKEVSMVRWYVRWVMSHSLSCLQEAQEQVEYVLEERGMPSMADMETAAREISFVEAVSWLGRDRHQVIEAERRRMRSNTRTFRENLSPLAVTSATNSFLSAEEKYRYQEYYNRSEHVMTLLHHALHLNYASRSREPSLVDPNEFSYLDSTQYQNALSTDVRLSDADDVRSHAELAMKALQEERDVIMMLLRNIQERQETGTVVGMTREHQQKSRRAAVAVYKYLLDDIAMLREHLQAGTQFLMDYDGWIQHHFGVNHQKVVLDMGLQASLDISLMTTAEPHLMLNSSLLPLRDRVVSDMYSSPTGQLPRHVEEVCEAFMTILRLSTSRTGIGCHGRVGESMYRRWMCMSLRYTCVQVVQGRWLADLLLAGIDDIASNLVRFVTEYLSKPGAAQSHVTELNAVLRCFLSLVMDGTTMRKVQRESSVPMGCGTSSICTITTPPRNMDVSVAFSLDENFNQPEKVAFMTEEDENIWGALFDALWFQADPTGCAHGGFLIPKDLTVDPENGFGFLRLEYITLPERMPNLRSEWDRRFFTFYMNLHYTIHPADMSPARSLAQVMEDNVSATTSTSVTTRYGYTRRVLYIFSILEQRQLLHEYTCHLSQVDLVPLEKTIYFARQRDDGHLKNNGADYPYKTVSRSGVGASMKTQKYVTVVGLLPPAAVHLLRCGALSPGAQHMVNNEGSSSLSITLLIGNMLLNIASRGKPLLDGMYLMGETLREQGMWDAESGTSKSTDRGIPNAGEEKGINKTKQSNLSLILPMLRTLDKYISSAEFEKMLEETDREMRHQPQKGFVPTATSVNGTKANPVSPRAGRR